MRKTIYLHIGHYKTGTTALQVFLARNRAKLLRRGLGYPEKICNHAKHSKLAFSLYHATGVDTLMHGYRDATPPEEIWAQIFAAARASKAPKLLVSSEEFMRLGAHPAAGGDHRCGPRGVRLPGHRLSAGAGRSSAVMVQPTG